MGNLPLSNFFPSVTPFKVPSFFVRESPLGACFLGSPLESFPPPGAENLVFFDAKDVSELFPEKDFLFPPALAPVCAMVQ